MVQQSPDYAHSAVLLTAPTSDELQTVLDRVWATQDSQPEMTGYVDISQGRGIFSRVFAVELQWPVVPPHSQTTATRQPHYVVIKLAALGPNREAAIASGAYAREALAYQTLLQDSPIPVPVCHGVSNCADGAIDFVLEDLRSRRSVDQIEGLVAADAKAVVQELGRWHHSSRTAGLIELGISTSLRRSTPKQLPHEGLLRGLETLHERWSDLLSERQIQNFTQLVENRSELIEDFDRSPISLCHGDVRADNLAFDDGEHRVLFYDWQQVALQLPEADLAWLCATSLEPSVRRAVERELCQLFADASGQPDGPTWDRYRSGLVLPGLAVLFLAQRELTTERTRRFVATSLVRIATAIDDHDLAGE